MKIRSKICQIEKCCLAALYRPAEALYLREEKTKDSDPEQLNRLDENTPEIKWKVIYGSHLMIKPCLEYCLSNLTHE